MELKHLTKAFGGLVAVNDLSVKVAAGKVTAIIGPNGSGKSTLFNLITAVLKADAGQIIFEGEDISRLNVFERSKKGISRTFQDVRVFDNLSIEDHLRLALADDDAGLWAGVLRKESDCAQRIVDVLELVGLDRESSAWGSELSYGQQKLLSLAMAIASDHKILLLDEPVAGVNPALRDQMKLIIKNLRKRGETIVLIEHDMNFVMDLADEIVVLDEGKLLAQGSPKKIRDDPKVLEAYLGD